MNSTNLLTNLGVNSTLTTSTHYTRAYHAKISRGLSFPGYNVRKNRTKFIRRDERRKQNQSYQSSCRIVMKVAGWKATALVAVAVAVTVGFGQRYGYLNFGTSAVVERLEGLKDLLGVWAMPAYVAAHTATLALCLPHAVAFEAAASLLFGFFNGLICVFAAKVFGASLSFLVGRAVFRSSRSAMESVQRNKYFHVIARGVERDGWKFVLLARFSPLPSYVINYALAATNVGFFVDFLLPTIIGCLPMILQNTSIGSLAGAAVTSTTGSKKSQLFSYLFPLLGILSSIIISFRIKKYNSSIVSSEEFKHSTEDS